jgi:protein tyrosine phosphatase (PTP) superfamily phosphohydrolase (DUF442 family)
MTMLVWLVGLYALFVIAGNLAILAVHRRARRISPPATGRWAAGARNAHDVSEKVKRSGRPRPGTYEELSRRGVTTVIDLRAEGGDGPSPDTGLSRLRHPMRDGQAPDTETLDAVLEAMRTAPGSVLIHCSAGVGRTGSIVAAWQIIEEGVDGGAALRHMLSVGPPSLEQIDFVTGLPDRRHPRWWMVALSRALDAPRRAWSRVRALGSALRASP